VLLQLQMLDVELMESLGEIYTSDTNKKVYGNSVTNASTNY